MMKKFILIIFIAAGFISPKNVLAQSFTVDADTVYATVGSLANVEDMITNTTNSSITINWNVIATNFPSDWIATLGICDNVQCYSNGSNSALWNGASGPMHTSSPYASGLGDFHVQMDLSNAPTAGTYYVTVNLAVQGSLGNSRTETYIITRANLGIANVNNAENISLYPNPAANNINVVYDQNLGVKNIAIYNIIGKILTYYKVSGTSANLDISNIPSGIYFIRLLDNSGNTIATRKFTHQ